MRLFIAIDLQDEVKDKISKVIQELESYSVKGNFTLIENLHVTIVFIGETQKLPEIVRAMDSIDADRFQIRTNSLGKFSRGGGDLYWIGIEKSTALLEIHKALCEELTTLSNSLFRRGRLWIWIRKRK